MGKGFRNSEKVPTSERLSRKVQPSDGNVVRSPPKSISVSSAESKLDQLKAKYKNLLSPDRGLNDSMSGVGKRVNRDRDIFVGGLDFLSESSRAMLREGEGADALKDRSPQNESSNGNSRETFDFTPNSTPRSRSTVVSRMSRKPEIPSHMRSHRHINATKSSHHPSHLAASFLSAPSRSYHFSRDYRDPSHHLKIPSFSSLDISSNVKETKSQKRNHFAKSSRSYKPIRRSLNPHSPPRWESNGDTSSQAHMERLIIKLQEKIDRMERTISRAGTPIPSPADNKKRDDHTDGYTRSKPQVMGTVTLDDPMDLSAWIFIFLLFFISGALYFHGEPVFIVANAAFIFILSLKYLII